MIVSIAQFRPEKNHELQLRAFSIFKNQTGQQFKKVKMMLIGSIRGKEDEILVDKLKKLRSELGLDQVLYIY